MSMNASEVVWFLNHKYGETAALEETSDAFIIYTSKSDWKIFKSDFKRFGRYALYHSNNCEGKNHHLQMYGYTVPYLIYCAITHDLPQIFGDRKSWDAFQESWQRYLYGQQLWKSVIKWDEECAIEAYMRGDFDHV